MEGEEQQQPPSAVPGDAPDSPTKPPAGDNPSAPNLTTALDPEGLPLDAEEKPKEKKSNITEEMAEDMKKIWDVFDTETTNQVPIMYLNKILRALDIDL